MSTNNIPVDVQEWANDVLYDGHTSSREEAFVAAETINDFPESWVSVDAVRGLVEQCRTEINESDTRNRPLERLYDALKELLPEPSTLAEYPEDQRHEFVDTDVMVEGWDSPSRLVAIHKNEGAVLGQSPFNPWPCVETRPLTALTPFVGDSVDATAPNGDVVVVRDKDGGLWKRKGNGWWSVERNLTFSVLPEKNGPYTRSR